MNRSPRTAIVVSASSDIGNAMSQRWLAGGWRVFGTYRTNSSAVDGLRSRGARLVYCDLAEADSIREACAELTFLCPQWDVLAMCPGTLEPIGPFSECDIDEWEESIRLNFTSQLRVVHELLPSRRAVGSPGPCVLLFAGGGTNSAPVNYSAYVVSKIALIKMCELLDAEVQDSRFVILGPGWVRTKIHDANLRAGERAGDNYRRLLEHSKGDDSVPMGRLLDCCDWLVDAPREVVSGRNFSVVFDIWGAGELESSLRDDPHMYKLRRHGNDRLVREQS